MGRGGGGVCVRTCAHVHARTRCTADLRFRRSLTELLPKTAHESMVTHDLVMAHYTLSELSNDNARASAMAVLWRLVAPGGLCRHARARRELTRERSAPPAQAACCW